MTYQHVVVVMSIVVGLSVTQLLRGAAQLYRNRRRVRTHWLHSAWVALTVVFSFLLWWTFWSYRDIADWNFLAFVIYLSPAVVFYFLAAIAIPDPSDPVEDMRQYYFSNRAGFFGAFALYGAVAMLTAVVVRGLPLLDSSNLFRIAMVALLLNPVPFSPGVALYGETGAAGTAARRTRRVLPRRAARPKPN